MIKYTIIIPHHNIPRLLSRCLRSIPDCEEIQVIVIDDNSSEDIVSFCEFPGLERRYTKIIFDKSGRGAGYARNLGLPHVKGKWLLFADADDYFYDNFYETIRSYYDNCADLILFKAESVDSDDFSPSNRHKELNQYIDDVRLGKITAKTASILMPTPWCRMIKSELVRNNSIQFDHTISANDVMFITKATNIAEQVIVSNDILYVVTTRKGSLWNNTSKDMSNYLCRMDVYITRNNYLKGSSYPKIPIIEYIYKARHFGLIGVFYAFKLALSRGALFSGVSTLLIALRNKLK